MFNRRIIILILALGFALGFLLWKWNEPAGISLNAAAGPVSSARWTLDLSGSWKLYSSLRQAWVTETEKESPKDWAGYLTGGIPGYLPSSQGFHVAAKTFRIPAEWNARALILELNGVKGRLSVYLNGIESTNRVGMIDGEGGKERLNIPLNALRYGQDNLILLELSAPLSQGQTFLGLHYPVEGRITGSIAVQAVTETSIEDPRVRILWDQENAQVQVDFLLNHRGFSEYGPWAVRGVVSDGSAEVAQAETVVEPDENTVQRIRLTFDIPKGRAWSPQDPFLYQFYLTVTNPKGDKDDLAFPLALSSIRYEDGNFTVNHEPIPIKGLALSPEQENRLRESGELSSWLKGQKEKGYNLIYIPGDFPDELWFQEADKIGMGIWAELPGNSMVPGNRLSRPEAWEGFLRLGSLHPSLWAYTAGKGLEVIPTSDLASYMNKVQAQTDPIPSFALRLTDLPGVSPSFSPRYSQGKIEAGWGVVEFTQEGLSESPGNWPDERWVSGLWAAIVFFIAWGNLTAKNWRYKELTNKKPKRPLRRAWFWHGVALLSREMTLAGIMTSLIFGVRVPWTSVIPNQWPFWEGLRQQSPVLIWIILGLIFTIIRLLQVGVVAPHMPESPAPMGLALWMERRYLWNWVVALLWAAHLWGVPYFVSILAYLGFSLLFLPLRIRDVRRIGGQYRSFLIVPGFIIVIVLVMSLFRLADWVYLWQLMRAL